MQQEFHERHGIEAGGDQVGLGVKLVSGEKMSRRRNASSSVSISDGWIMSSGGSCSADFASHRRARQCRNDVKTRGNLYTTPDVRGSNATNFRCRHSAVQNNLGLDHFAEVRVYRPNTRDSAMDGMTVQHLSISSGKTLRPARLMTAVLRESKNKNPSASSGRDRR
jgi:hypothetical protein